MTTYPWAYRCSACGELVEVDDVRTHVEQHRAAKDYPGGHIGLEREDKPATAKPPE